MATCNICGEQIVFRYVGGQPTPIHVHGNWCRGYMTTESKGRGPFRTLRSYVVPNASCPVCGETVFFYQAPNGGRVFFDDLGWPWPKHPCTDNRKKVGRPNSEKRSGNIHAFRSRAGHKLVLYDLDDIDQSDVYVKLVFRRQDANKRRTAFIKKQSLKKWKLKLDDFFEAPSFVIDMEDSLGDALRVDFICARLGKIIRIKMSKTCDAF